MTATYSINGKDIDYKNLNNIKIDKEDYIGYITNIKNLFKKNINNGNQNQVEKV